MVDVSSISAALSSLIAARDIAQAMVGLHDAAAFQGKLIEFQAKIIEAQSSAMTANDERATLLETIRKLEEEVASFEAWETEKQKYELNEVDTGAFACVLKEEAQASETPHWICTTCYSNRKKTLLQDIGPASVSGVDFRKRIYKCFSCNSQIRVQSHISPTKKREA
jgi:hypothetical protein